VINIFSILPIRTILCCKRCCVPSEKDDEFNAQYFSHLKTAIPPQSKSQTSAPSRRARDEWIRVDDGWAEAVPRKVSCTSRGVVLEGLVEGMIFDFKLLKEFFGKGLKDRREPKDAAALMLVAIYAIQESIRIGTQTQHESKL
jgi:hypothetical protein